MINEPVRR